jgi:hypothetical protein
VKDFLPKLLHAMHPHNRKNSMLLKMWLMHDNENDALAMLTKTKERRR